MHVIGLLWGAVAWAGGTWVAVVDVGSAADPSVGARLSKQLGTPVEVVPATDLVQPGRERRDTPPGAQPGRVEDAELTRIRQQLELASDAGDCGRLLGLADAVQFVDRSAAREVRFDALVAAAECGPEAGLPEDGALAHAAALTIHDPALVERVASDTRARLELARGGLETTEVDVSAFGEALEVRVDGVVVASEGGRVPVRGRRADLQLVRTGRGRAQWGPSFRIEPGSEACRPYELAQRRIDELAASLATDGGASFGASVGAWMGLVDADALYVAVTDRRKLVLWQWQAGAGRFAPIP